MIKKVYQKLDSNKNGIVTL